MIIKRINYKKKIQYIWKLRNNAVFRGERFNIEVYMRVRSTEKEWKFKNELIFKNGEIKVNYKGEEGRNLFGKMEFVVNGLY